MSEPEPTPPQTLLQIVAECDSFVVPPSASVSGKAEEEALASWHLFPDASSPALGLIRPIVLAQLKLETTNSWKFWTHNNVDKVSFADHITTPNERSSVMKELCERWRDQGLWPGQIGPKKWRGEMYPIYRHPFGKLDAPLGSESSGDDIEDDSRNYAFRMERSACALFGTVTYGVHMTVYQDDPEKATRNEQGALENESCRIWVPKRAKTKQTWPGYLDNSVAGGITCGITPFECAVKEAMEEASIPEDIVTKYAKSVGCVSYFYRTNAGWLQPEVEYVFHLRVPLEVQLQLTPLDGEVESFECLPLKEVVAKVRSGLFKPNCAIVIIDFLIHQGYLTPENEPDFLEIMTRIHGRFGYERW